MSETNRWAPYWGLTTNPQINFKYSIYNNPDEYLILLDIFNKNSY